MRMKSKNTPKSKEKAKSAPPQVAKATPPQAAKAAPSPGIKAATLPPDAEPSLSPRISQDLLAADVVIILGRTREGRLFSHFLGEKVGVIEAQGLLHYGQQLLDGEWVKRVTPTGQ